MPKPYHVGRSWGGPGPLEEACPCPKTDCGLVDWQKADSGCSEHAWSRAKSMRVGHHADSCWGAAHFAEAECPVCGPTRLEKHPHTWVYRCFNCMEWLANGDGQLFLFPLESVIWRKRDSP